MSRQAGERTDCAMRIALLVALATMAVAAFGVMARSTYGAQTSSDEPQYLLTALSLADDFDLDISDEIERRAFEPFHEIGLNTQTFALNESGQRISPHDPLLPLVSAPAMWVGGWVGVRVLLVLIGGLVAGLTAWTAIRRFGVSSVGGLIGVGSVMVGAPIAAYSTQVFPEILAALCVAGIVAAATAPRLGTRHLAAIAVAVIALPWLSVKYGLVAAVAVAVVGWRLAQSRRWTDVGTLAALLALAGVVYFIVHQRIYGGWTVYSTGDHFIDDGEFAVVGTDPNYLGRSRRLVGLLADRRFGLMPWAPIWLLAPAAVAAFLARPRHNAGGSPGENFDGADHRWLVALPLIAGWFTATFVALTMHGWWSPGRQIVVIVPLVGLPLASWIDGRRALMWVAGAAGVIGASNWIWLGVEAMTDRRVLIVDFHETAALGYRLVSPLFAQGWPVIDNADLVLAVWGIIVATSMIVAFLHERQHWDGSAPSDTDQATDEAAPDFTTSALSDAAT